MDNFGALMAEYQNMVMELELIYGNYQTARLLGTAESHLALMRDRIQEKEGDLKNMLDRIDMINDAGQVPQIDR